MKISENMGQNVTMMNVTINIFGDRRSRMWTYTTHEGVVIPTRSYEYIMNFFKHKITVLMNVVRFVTIRRSFTAFGNPEIDHFVYRDLSRLSGAFDLGGDRRLVPDDHDCCRADLVFDKQDRS